MTGLSSLSLARKSISLYMSLCMNEISLCIRYSSPVPLLLVESLNVPLQFTYWVGGALLNSRACLRILSLSVEPARIRVYLLGGGAYG